MNCKEIEGLIEFLKKSYRDLTKTTNWEMIIALWNDINWDKTQIPIDAEIPDYTADMPNYTEDLKNTDDTVSRK